MPKSKWDDAEEPTFNNFYKIWTGNFEYALLNANGLQYQQKLTVILLDVKCPWGPMIQQPRHIPRGQMNWNETSKLESTIY